MASRLNSLWRNFLLKRKANRIAAAAMEQCWTRVRLKAVSLAPTELADYMRKHSAAEIHRHVDSLVHDDSSIDGGTANQLIVIATERLVSRLSRRLAKQTPGIQRAA